MRELNSISFQLFHDCEFAALLFGDYFLTSIGFKKKSLAAAKLTRLPNALTPIVTELVVEYIYFSYILHSVFPS